MKILGALSLGLLFALMFTSTSAAIDPTATDSVYNTLIIFKTGGKLVGKIIQDNPGKKMTVEMRNGEKFTADYRDIASVTTDGKADEQRTQALESIRKTEMARIQPLFRVSAFYIPTTSNIPDTWMYLVLFKRLSRNFFMGIGAGSESFHTIEFKVVPFFLEAKQFLGEGKVATFAFGRAGWSLGWLDTERYRGLTSDTKNLGGRRIEAGIGGMYTIGPHKAFTWTFVYFNQGVSSKHVFIDGSYSSLRTEIGFVY